MDDVIAFFPYLMSKMRRNLIIFPSVKGGNFIYPMMHRLILYYQASERTRSNQFNRDVTVEQRWKATCFGDKTFCTVFAV